MNNRRERASRQEIFQRLEQLLGPDAEVAIEQVIKHIQAGENEQGIKVLRFFDATLGGIGVHNLNKEHIRDVYRPVRYVSMILGNETPEDFTRFLVHTACVYVEGVLKKMARLGFLGQIFERRWPMGKLLHRKFAKRLPEALYENLLWLNDYIFNFAKHDFDLPEDIGDVAVFDSHLFALDEAIAIYLVARQLVVDLERLAS